MDALPPSKIKKGKVVVYKKYGNKNNTLLEKQYICYAVVYLFSNTLLFFQ